MQQQPMQGYGGEPGRFGDTGPYPSSSYPSYASGPYPSGPYPSASGAAATYSSGPYPAMPAPQRPAQSMSPYVPVGPALAQMPPAPPPLNGGQRALLAVLIYNPLALLAYLLYLYGPGQSCVAGPFCGIGNLPGILQAFLLLVVAGLLWGLITLGLPRLLEAIPWQSPFARGIRALTEYHLVRPLLGIYGAILVLGLLVALFTGRLTPAALIFGAISAYVCLRCAFSRPLIVPPAQPTYT